MQSSSWKTTCGRFRWIPLALLQLIGLAAAAVPETDNSPPVARAGADRTVPVQTIVHVDGSASTDLDGDILSYDWTLIGKPDGSTARLIADSPQHPLAHFLADLPGEYVARLSVSDGIAQSEVDITIVSTRNSAPTAHAGVDRTARLHERIQLDGSRSMDPDGDNLRYEWTLSAPPGSKAQLSSPWEAQSAFVVDQPGRYVATLTVSDGEHTGEPHNVVISTTNSAPAAVISGSQRAEPGERVVLDGTLSADADNEALGFAWSLLSKPARSAVNLRDTDQPRAILIPDLPGLYVAQLIVHDGNSSSQPRTLKVTVRVTDETTSEPRHPVSQPAASTTHTLESNEGRASPPRTREQRLGSGSLVLRQPASTLQSSSVWPDAVLLDQLDGTSVNGHDLRTHSTGNASEVWWYAPSSTQSVWVRNYDAATGWTAPASIPWPHGAASRLVVRNTDTNGSVLAIWNSNTGFGHNIKAAFYSPSSGWSTTQTLASGSQTILDLNVGVGPNGHAAVIWALQINSDLSTRLHGAFYVPGTGWRATAQIATDQGNNPSLPDVSITNGGDAYALWLQNRFCYVLRYSLASATWIFQLTEQGETADMAADDAGAFLLTSSNSRVVAARYVSATGSSTSTIVQSGTASRGRASIAMNAAGDALGAWSELSGTHSLIRSARFVAASGSWQTPLDTVLDVTTANDRRDLEVLHTAIHSGGKRFVTWREAHGSQFSLWTGMSPNPASAWAAPLLITQTVGGPAVDLTASSMSFAGSERVFASWLQQKPSSSTLLDLYGKVMAWTGSGAPEQPPTPRADAGPKQSVFEGAVVTLNGSQSQGAIASYLWTQISGSPVTLNGANTATPSFTASLTDANPVSSNTYLAQFRLTVSDALGNQSSDVVDISITSLPSPKVVRAAARDAANIVSWAATSASSYNIYWSRTPGVTKTNGNKVAAAARPFTHASLTNGTPYYYAVSADYSGAESALSEEVTAIPNNIPTPRSWDAPLQVSTGAASLRQYDVASDPDGNAIAVWGATAPDGVASVFASRLTLSSGWSAPVRISSTALASSSDGNVQVTVSANSALAVWTGSSPASSTALFASRWTAETGWSTPAIVSEATQTVGAPQIASDHAGNAVVAWPANSPARIFSALYLADSGWQPPVELQNTTGNSFLANVAMAAGGNAITAWNNGGYIYLARYFPSSGWQTLGYAGGSSPLVSINASGDAAILFAGGTGIQAGTWARTSTVPAPAQAMISTPTSSMQFRMDAQGNRVAVWGDTNLVKTSSWSQATQQWSTPRNLQSLLSLQASAAAMDMDGHGNAVAAWSQMGAQINPFSSSYEASAGWSPDTAIDASMLGQPVVISLGTFGNGVALWQRSDNTVWAARYRGPNSSKRPIALAGANQTVTEGELVTLRGRGLTYTGSSISGYSWRQVAGPAVALSDPLSAQPTFTAPAVSSTASLEFELTVTNSAGQTHSATVTIIVRDVPAITLTSNLTEASPGQWIRFTATLGGSPVPSGTVQYFDGATSLGSATVANGTAQFDITTLGLGDHSVTARYSGDDAYGPATSAAVAVSVTDVPIVDITSPANGTVLVSPASLLVQTTASARVDTIARIELMDNGAMIGSANYASNSATYSFTLSNITLGVHVFTSRATDSRGKEKVSAPVSVRVLGTPSIALSGLSSPTFLIAPGFAYLQAQPSSPNGAIAKVEFFSNSNTSIGTVTAPPYALAWNNIAVGNYSVTARVTDEYNRTATSTAIAVTVAAAPTVTMTSPTNNALITGTVVPVLRGSVQAPPNSTVIVNNQIATIAANGTFFVNNLPLQTGTNTIAIVVTTQDGQTATQTYTLRSQGTSAFNFTASPTSGLAPLISRVSVTANGTPPAIVRVDYSCNNNSTIDGTSTTLGAFQCVYAQPGSYTVRADVIGRNSSGATQVIFTATQSINVATVQSLDAHLRGVYAGMLSKLRAGNISGALTAVSPDNRDRYQQMFNSISDLPATIDQLGEIADALFYGNFAEYLIVRPTSDGYEGYRMYFIRGGDGVWRIDSM